MRSLRSTACVLVALLILGCAAGALAQESAKKTEAKVEKTGKKIGSENPIVVLETSMGDIRLELFSAEAPVTVESFLAYVRDGFYDGTIFHRVMDNFMIQGGGFTTQMEQKITKPPIRNEATNRLNNKRGTIAMARAQDPHSATSQFFINVKENTNLNHYDKLPRRYGYCVFGHVIEGMGVVDKIKAVKTGQHGLHQNVPLHQVLIKRAYVSEWPAYLTQLRSASGGTSYVPSMSSVLVEAIDSGDPDRVREAIEKGADPNYRDPERGPALLLAMGRARYEPEIQMESGSSQEDNSVTRTPDASYQAGDAKGTLPEQYLQIGKILLMAGADVHAKDADEKTALYYASENEYAQAEDLLRSAGAR
jgi:peptidyl-prolyl cis-trans isomerase B (cyclophilin B)